MSRLIAGPAKTLATLLFAVMGPLLLAVGLAPHAYADTNSYLNCLANYRITGDTNTELALGQEAYNEASRMKASNIDQPYVREILILMRKYNLSDHMASSIVGCANTYPPV